MIWSGGGSAAGRGGGGKCDSMACCFSVTVAMKITSMTSRMSMSGVTLISAFLMSG